ncbi:sensor histidine kinase [Colwellia hornerae]|uniref:histidine kinase n=1 Tax=Colwellia hornerae TaxID=89402 RepID=A0A5C6QK72_9GAMM|nr:sensor histidine kinase [Colwellia hornerae]TWX53395.1 HAMP domain-containing protein [Colwellia hornerae]TWX60215.1 HAMP domain-containing protein [Colwellia hornerae]TWX68992.1 HAMP domain-containing protein [Colwellia hornerae]
MTNKLFLKLCLIIALSLVIVFYLLNLLTSKTEEGMSYLSSTDKQTLNSWGKQAEKLYLSGNKKSLDNWLEIKQKQEDTWMVVAAFDIENIAGATLKSEYYKGYNLGRNVNWKIHLYFDLNPVMQMPFSDKNTSLLVYLPNRMRPGFYWQYTQITLQIIVPAILLIFLSYLLYRYIMTPLLKLKVATREFSKGKFNVSAKKLMGNRNDEFSDLAFTFDQMAARIGEQFASQKQLIADLSHELRTPLTRLDIALDKENSLPTPSENIKRIDRESKQIRKLVEDTLTLAWLENEQPKLQQESLELVDLLDVLIEDAKFEFPNKSIISHFPNTAIVENSSHRAAGQALENVLRNALRYTPVGKTISLFVSEQENEFKIKIIDQGPGVPEKLLNTIFKPFFRVDSSRSADSESFGLGLALAERQLAAIRGSITASNGKNGGLCMLICLPKN